MEIVIAPYIVIKYDHKMKSRFCSGHSLFNKSLILIFLGKNYKKSDLFRIKVFLLPVFVYFLTKSK